MDPGIFALFGLHAHGFRFIVMKGKNKEETF